MRGRLGRGDGWITPHQSVCPCLLSFGLSLSWSLALCPAFQQCPWFFSLISLSSISPWLSVLFSLCLCSISQSLVPASVSFPFPLTHTCLSASLPPSSPPTPSQMHRDGHKVHRKRGNGLGVYRPLNARGPKPSILLFPSTFRPWSPSFPQPGPLSVSGTKAPRPSAAVGERDRPLQPFLDQLPAPSCA